MNGIVLSISSFFYVALRSFQQRNVAFNKYYAVPIVSYAMAYFDVFIIVKAVDYGLTVSTVFWLGSGGAAGCICAMILHNRIFKK